MQWWMITRRIHTSWLIAFGCAGLVIGVALAKWIPCHVHPIWLIIATIIVALTLWKGFLYLAPLLFMLCVFAGCVRGSGEMQELAVYKNIYGSKVTVQGTVSDDADTDASGSLILRLNEVVVDGHKLHGSLWVSTQTKYDIKRGDSVHVTGKMGAGFGTFAGVMYRAVTTKVERPEPGDIARRVRDWFADGVRTAISEPQASLGIGYLVGQRRALPEELSDALKIVGLTHIVVASGYNLTILVRLTRRLFAKMSKYLSTMLACAMIVSFVAVTGASPSMSRAGLVCGLSLAAWYYGRSFHPVVLLCFAAAVTVMLNPSYAWGDLGWQLSFAAFAAVMIVAPLIQAYFFGVKKPGTIRQILGETVSAHIVTLPIVLFAFGQMSNVAVISNILVLPFVPLAMLLTFISGVAGLLSPALASVVGLPADWLLGYMVAVAEYLAKVPWAQSTFQITIWMVVVMYGLMIAACYYMTRATKIRLRDANIVE